MIMSPINVQNYLAFLSWLQKVCSNMFKALSNLTSAHLAVSSPDPRPLQGPLHIPAASCGLQGCQAFMRLTPFHSCCFHSPHPITHLLRVPILRWISCAWTSHPLDCKFLEGGRVFYSSLYPRCLVRRKYQYFNKRVLWSSLTAHLKT